MTNRLGEGKAKKLKKGIASHVFQMYWGLLYYGWNCEKKKTKANHGIKHYALTVIIICQQNVIFFGGLCSRKGMLKKYFSLDYSWFEKHNKNYTFVIDKMKKQPWEKSINCFHFESTVPS